MVTSAMAPSLAPPGPACGVPGQQRGGRRRKGSIAPSEFMGTGLPAITAPHSSAGPGAVCSAPQAPRAARETRAALPQKSRPALQQGCGEGLDARLWGLGFMETPAGTGRRGDQAVAKGLGSGVLGSVSGTSQVEDGGQWAGAEEGLAVRVLGSQPKGIGLHLTPGGQPRGGPMRGDRVVARGGRRGTSAARMVGGGSGSSQLAWPRRSGGKMDSKTEVQLRWEGLMSDLLRADLFLQQQQRMRDLHGDADEGGGGQEGEEGGAPGVAQQQKGGAAPNGGSGSGGGGGSVMRQKKSIVWKRVLPSVEEVLTSALRQGWLTRKDVTGALVRCSQLKRFSCIVQILDWARSPSGGLEWWGALTSQDHCMRITALSRTQGVEAAKQAFRDMEDSLEPVNAIACTALLEGLCRAQDMAEADELLARMETGGPAPTPVTYQTYLHGLSKAGRIDEMERAMARLEQGQPVCAPTPVPTWPAHPSSPQGVPPASPPGEGDAPWPLEQAVRTLEVQAPTEEGADRTTLGVPEAGSMAVASAVAGAGAVAVGGAEAAGAGASPVGRSSRGWSDAQAREGREWGEDAALRGKLYGGGVAQQPTDLYRGLRRPGEVPHREGEGEGEGEGEEGASGSEGSGREGQGVAGGEGVGGPRGGAAGAWGASGAASLDVGMFNLLLHAYSQAGRFEDATRAFRRMKALAVAPTRSTYNILIAMFARDCRSKEAEGVLRQMQAAGVRPDVYTYTALLTSYGRAGRAEEAQAVFRDMVMCKILPSGKSYTALVDAYSRAGDVEKAERVFKEMTKRYPFHLPGYTAMLGSYCREGMMEQAETLLRRVVYLASGKAREGPIVTLGPSVFNMVMGGHRRGRDLDAVIATFERMLAAEVEPDVGSFHILIKAYAECGDYDGALFAFREMVEVAGLRPDGAIKSALLDACLVGGEGEGVEGGDVDVAQRRREVEELMREFEEEGAEGVLREEGYGDEDLELVGMAL